MAIKGGKHSEDMLIAKQKQIIILTFLANGEVWTTLEILSILLGKTRTAIERTLKKLIIERAVRAEKLEVGSKIITMFGITQHGIGLVEGKGKPFYPGNINPITVNHHLQSQKARLKAIQNGGTKWKAGKTLHDKGLLKVPDGVYQAESKKWIAVEIENYIKSPSRFAIAISLHLQEMAKGDSWNEVHYIVPKGQVENIKRKFSLIDLIPVKGKNVKLETQHRLQFKFFDFDTWNCK